MKFFIAVILALCCSIANAETKTVDFNLVDTNGNRIHLSDYKGKWVIVTFYAPWCPLCWKDVPVLNKLNAEKNIKVIGIMLDYGEAGDSISDLIKDKNMRYDRHVLGGSRKSRDSAFRQIGPVDFFPTSYVYGPTGEILMFMPGQFKEQVLFTFMSSYK
jgi:thiol-disulfide isomerase/thioredoxin